MKITKIKKLNNGKYKLKLDNEENITLYDEVILNHNLLFHKEIDYEELNELNKDNEYFKTYHKVLNYALYKMRSYFEIKNYMIKMNLPEEVQKEIIKKLEELHLLNDKSYVKAFISDKINLSNDGPLKIKSELLKQQIDENLIINELSNYDDEIFKEKIKKIIVKKTHTQSHCSLYLLKQKILNYLINLGYEKEMIFPYLNEIKNQADNLDKEYQKLLQKLNKKYQGEELKKSN